MSVVNPEIRRPGAPAVLAAAFACGLSNRLALGISVSLVIGVALAPVWLPALKHYVGARFVVLLGCLAAAWGTVLSFLDTGRITDFALLRSETVTLAGLICTIGMLVWSRHNVGPHRTALAFGLGFTLNSLMTGLQPENPWKYTLAIPIIITTLALARLSQRKALEAATLALLAGISGLNDSRSMTAFLLLAAAVAVWQMGLHPHKGHPRPILALASLAILGTGIFMLVQALLLEGVLGDAAQQRTEAQLSTTGSLISGGRPELGASIALISKQPWGYGAGTVPTPLDVFVAKSGMSELNYEPNNGYVEVFMFGGHYEVHSVLGDVWIRFGPLGAAFILCILGIGLSGLASMLSRRSSSALVVLLGVLATWDAMFSPLLTSYRNLALFFAMCAIPRVIGSTLRQNEGHRERGQLSGAGGRMD